MILALKLFLTPILIASVTLAGRRWGPGVSGWLIGLPLTSGPVSVVLALQYGPDFAARAAVGTLGGMASVLAFCLVYSVAALRASWPVCALAGGLAFWLSTSAWNQFSLSLWPTSAVLLVAIVVTLLLFPRRGAPANGTSAWRWDIPARMIVASAFVLALTAAAANLGPQLSGLLSPFPIYALVMAAFAHRQQGTAAAARLLRGVVLGAFGFGAFFLIVGGLLPGLGLEWTYALAAAVALGVNGLSLRVAR